MGNLGNRHPIKAKKIWNASRILRVILAPRPYCSSLGSVVKEPMSGLESCSNSCSNCDVTHKIEEKNL